MINVSKEVFISKIRKHLDQKLFYNGLAKCKIKSEHREISCDSLRLAATSFTIYPNAIYLSYVNCITFKKQSVGIACHRS